MGSIDDYEIILLIYKLPVYTGSLCSRLQKVSFLTEF